MQALKPFENVYLVWLSTFVLLQGAVTVRIRKIRTAFINQPRSGAAHPILAVTPHNGSDRARRMGVVCSAGTRVRGGCATSARCAPCSRTYRSRGDRSPASPPPSAGGFAARSAGPRSRRVTLMAQDADLCSVGYALDGVARLISAQLISSASKSPSR